MQKKIVIALLVALAWLVPAQRAFAAAAVPTENDPVAARREVALARQLRCLVCQNETIADSHAALAVDLRRQVREQIAAGKTDREVIEYMTARYGDFVLYKPPLQPNTALLWLGPLLLAALGALIAWRVIAARRSAAPAPLAEPDRARARRLLADGADGSADRKAP